jgi:hypothetical protein
MLAPFDCLTTRFLNSLKLCRLVVEVSVTCTIWPLVLPTAETKSLARERGGDVGSR